MVMMIQPIALLAGSRDDLVRALSASEAWQRAKELGMRDVKIFHSPRQSDSDERQEYSLVSRWWSSDNAEKFSEEWDHGLGDHVKCEGCGPTQVIVRT